MIDERDVELLKDELADEMKATLLSLMSDRLQQIACEVCSWKIDGKLKTALNVEVSRISLNYESPANPLECRFEIKADAPELKRTVLSKIETGMNRIEPKDQESMRF